MLVISEPEAEPLENPNTLGVLHDGKRISVGDALSAHHAIDLSVRQKPLDSFSAVSDQEWKKKESTLTEVEKPFGVHEADTSLNADVTPGQKLRKTAQEKPKKLRDVVRDKFRVF
jgi:hypothetical protein